MTPARLARRLVDKHGRLAAIRKVANRLDRYRTDGPHGAEITHPTRWLVWSYALARILGVPHRDVVDWLPCLTREPVRAKVAA